MNKFRFIRRNGKIVGPLTADRIDQLFSKSRLVPGDELSEHQDGPWLSVATLRERVTQTQKKKRDEAQRSRGSSRSKPIEVPDVEDVIERTPAPETSDTLDPPAIPAPSPGVSAFTDPPTTTGHVNPAESSAPLPFVPAVSTSPRQEVRSKNRPPNRTGEELDASNPLRWIFPWKWETDTQPYPMLVVYLRFSRAVLALFYLLFMLLGLGYLVLIAIGALRVAGDAESQLPLFATLIGVAVTALIWWLMGQLIYIAGMASIDVLRCFLAIERNTRQ